jgi:UDP-N-acetylmuramate--alanine ligase
MLAPTFAVVTNIDREHMDYYRDMEDMQDCFTRFVNKVPFYGAAILCLDDPYVQMVVPHVKRRRITYGLSAQADISAHGIRYEQSFGSTFTVWRGSGAVGDVTLRVPGLHNIYNALAAVAVGFELDIPFGQIAEGLRDFTGVNRRFQTKGDVGGVLVVDDYAHHPTEIRATLAAAKLSSAGRRMVVLFQPHRYTRTRDQMDEFARSFNNADVLLVTDIYAASEDPIAGVTAETLTEAIKSYGHKSAHYVGALDTAVKALLSEARPGDMVVTLGAGNVYQAGEQLVELLKKNGERKG